MLAPPGRWWGEDFAPSQKDPNIGVLLRNRAWGGLDTAPGTQPGTTGAIWRRRASGKRHGGKRPGRGGARGHGTRSPPSRGRGAPGMATAPRSRRWDGAGSGFGSGSGRGPTRCGVGGGRAAPVVPATSRPPYPALPEQRLIHRGAAGPAPVPAAGLPGGAAGRTRGGGTGRDHHRAPRGGDGRRYGDTPPPRLPWQPPRGRGRG